MEGAFNNGIDWDHVTPDPASFRVPTMAAQHFDLYLWRQIARGSAVQRILILFASPSPSQKRIQRTQSKDEDPKSFVSYSDRSKFKRGRSKSM